MEETTPATPPADSQGGKGDFLFNFGLVIALGGFLVSGDSGGSFGPFGAFIFWLVLLQILQTGWGAVVRPVGLASWGGMLIPLVCVLGAAVPFAAGSAGFSAWILLAGGGLAGWGAFRNSGIGFSPIGGDASPADKQFGSSFAFYLMVTIGLLSMWTEDGVSGTGNWLGGATLVLTLLALFASWSGMWKLPSMKEVTGKLGLILFLAPLEGALYGFLGVVAVLMRDSGSENFTTSFWPSGVSNLEGPAMVLLGSLLAIGVLLKGAKVAVEMEKARKAEERAARKASRQSSGAES